MKNKQSEKIEDYVFVTSNGEVRQLGQVLPENLDNLWGGKILGFPFGTDEATKDRFIDYVARGFLPRLRLRRAGIHLYELQSASIRTIVVNILNFLARSFTHSAGLAFAILLIWATLTPAMTSMRNIYAPDILTAFGGSFLSFAIEKHFDDEYQVVTDKEKAKVDKEHFKQWQKENGYAQ